MSASTVKKNRQAAREAGTDKKLLALQEEQRKQAQSKRRWTIGTILVVVLVLAIIFVNTSLFYRVIPAVSVDGKSLSAAEANYYYGNYKMYAQYFGEEYANQLAENDIIQMTALVNYANENGITLDDEEIARVDEQLAQLSETASGYGFSSVNAYLAAAYGKGVNRSIVRNALLDSALASKAYSTVQDSQEYTAEELEEAYQAMDGAYDLYDYAYYFVDAADSNIAEADALANAIEMAYLDGDEVNYSERFAVAVDSQLEGEQPEVLTGVTGSSLDATFSPWLTAERSEGDVTVIRSETDAANGDYVLVFLGRDDNSYNTVSVRHILVKAEADEDGSYSDEALAAAQARAEELLAQWQAGEATEESFAALANEYSEDDGSNTNGGLYEDIYKGQMVQEFNDFCFGDRQVGDTAIVFGQSSSYAGYHVMYFVGEGESYRSVLARDSLNSEFMQTWMSELTDGLEVTHKAGFKLV